jgi:hypothetical protein
MHRLTFQCHLYPTSAQETALQQPHRAVRLDLTFQQVKASERSGFPRFRGCQRDDTC